MEAFRSSRPVCMSVEIEQVAASFIDMKFNIVFLLSCEWTPHTLTKLNNMDSSGIALIGGFNMQTFTAKTLLVLKLLSSSCYS